jgi:hypothetical protein
LRKLVDSTALCQPNPDPIPLLGTESPVAKNFRLPESRARLRGREGREPGKNVHAREIWTAAVNEISGAAPPPFSLLLSGTAPSLFAFAFGHRPLAFRFCCRAPPPRFSFLLSGTAPSLFPFALGHRPPRATHRSCPACIFLAPHPPSDSRPVPPAAASRGV